MAGRQTRDVENIKTCQGENETMIVAQQTKHGHDSSEDHCDADALVGSCPCMVVIAEPFSACLCAK
jgi:hypothetical protein